MKKLRGFVLACGRSGTMWTAAALSEVGMLDARHESIEEWNPAGPWGEVEVNSFFWEDARRIQHDFPGVPIFHLVRDGRNVVRSILNRPRPGRTLETACEMWAERNQFLRQTVVKQRRYRLEDLVSDFSVFSKFAKALGAPYVRKWAWDRLSQERVNRNRKERLPEFRKWSVGDREVFWEICGREMAEYGYGS